MQKRCPYRHKYLSKDQNEKLKEALELSKDQHFGTTQSRKRKSLNEYSKRHKKRKIQALQEKAINLLSDTQFKVCGLEVKNMDSGCSDNFQICKANKENAVCQAVNKVLHTKERYGISDQAYHESSMVSESLPCSWKVKKQRNDMNIQWQVFPTPGDNTIGVQQSFKRKLKDRIKSLEQNSSSDALFQKTSTVHVKLTGDGTYIGPRQHIVTFGFNILDEGSAAKSFAGNHTVCIVRGPEDYESLSICLKDVISEISDIHNNGLEVDRNRHTVQFYLGAD